MSADTARVSMPLWAKALVAMGLVIAAAAVLLIGYVGYTILAVRSDNPPARVAAKAPGETFVVGEVSGVEGTPYVRVAIAASDRPGSYSYDRQDLRNILLLDTVTGQSRRLLPDNGRTIETMHWLPDTPAPQRVDGLADASTGKVGPERWYVLILKRAEGQTFDVVVGRIAGGQARVFENVEGVERVWTRDAGHIAMIVRADRRLSYRVVDMARLAPVAATPLAID